MIAGKLIRTSMGDNGTFGTLTIAGLTFVTGELPDHGNASEISSIPAGTYTCRRTHSNRFGREMYQVMDVSGRTGIRFHAANLMGDKAKGLQCELNGCIALGLGLGKVNGQSGILSSNKAIQAFEQLLDGEDFTLEIINEYLEAGTPAGSVA